MSEPIIVWYRSDLRVHDHLALAAACKNGSAVLPVFIFDQAITSGKFASANRNRFLLECLEDLQASLKKRGADLVLRDGDAQEALLALCKESGAKTVYYTADYSPYALRRDKKLEHSLSEQGIEMRAFGGRLAVHSLQKIKTKSGDPFKVFTPFWKSWQQVERREIVPTPQSIAFAKVDAGTLPTVESIADTSMLSRNTLKGGETAGRKRLHDFLNDDIQHYGEVNNDMAKDGTSRLSSYLHFGCLSAREIETLLPDSKGARSWHRQLAWREFYHYVLLHYPHPEKEFQERYRGMEWTHNKEYLDAWKNGRTGYPAVDAAMRQLKEEGWMHNRARLIVGSFLTKDLGLDWRDGEKHFMQWLIDGDMANNNGNWQWIASVGVDPAPVFRRLYNPSTQRDNYDPTGEYVRRYIPELKQVPDKYLSQPWLMPGDVQEKSNCTIGDTYPLPIVDHKEARLLALEKYRSQ